jgi:Cu-Zn family superoxide dismutase|tara:strand:- start:16919 stop:17485 length:567 start_codon:yes stop_codon:yes gene_type:complete
MKRTFSLLALGTGLTLVAACADPMGDGMQTGAADDSAAMEDTSPGEVGYANLTTAEGSAVGRAVFTETDAGVDVDAQLTGMAPGVHAVHVHQTGTCTPPDFTSAGGHWNPTNQPHPQHKGDLGNVTVDASGGAQLTATIDDVSLNGGTVPMLDSDGAALIVHMNADDMVSQPSGDAGARMACSPITTG